MTDIIERAEAALRGETPIGRIVTPHRFWTGLVRGLLAALKVSRDENERLKSYKSLPEGMVWQDYYSPDDVIKIRDELEIKNKRVLDDCCRVGYVCGEEFS